MSENIRKKLITQEDSNTVLSVKNSIQEAEEESQTSYFDFNNKNGSLKQRLFSKHPEIMKNVLDDKKQYSQESDLLELLGLAEYSKSVASPTKTNLTPTSLTNTHINSSNFTCDSQNNIQGERFDDLDKHTNEADSYTNRKRKREISLNRSQEIFDINAFTVDDERKNLEYALALSLVEYEKQSES